MHSFFGIQMQLTL